ncbi:hypothetical protein [Nocardiopsis suaedae]|uniref:Uncharacterized protein n=1 Tax=Nocardiopsis suaedae TaxID=3018444 RepID=A0ABT4TPZ3_9ACTN|nr:hypothetical protein [Nocardiopsis suaedae]MDA2806759.1 hypothetical protein [Nocardiopsis suaedae]
MSAEGLAYAAHGAWATAQGIATAAGPGDAAPALGENTPGAAALQRRWEQDGRDSPWA